MKPLEFFRTAQVFEILERSALVAAAPLRVQFVKQRQEGAGLVEFGHCAVCDHVNKTPAGKAACRADRAQAADAACAVGDATAFVCHMGLGCVTIPALPDRDAGFMLTVGPYCPLDEPRALENDVRYGLKALGITVGNDLPVSLSDIRVVPTGAMPALCKWTAEVLAEFWHELKDVSEEQPADTVNGEYHGGQDAAGTAQKAHKKFGALQGCGTARSYGPWIVAALAAGSRAQARALVRETLTDVCRGNERTKIGLRRARIVAVVSAALESAERAGISTAKCWTRFAELPERVRCAGTDEELTAAAMHCLGTIKPRPKRTVPRSTELTQLRNLVLGKLPGRVRLDEIASDLNQHPTAVTHRLQRKFGMSFTEYVGRVRVDMAKELLRDTRLGSGEVARRVGISDTSNFSKLFRRHEGISPLEYRRRHTGN